MKELVKYNLLLDEYLNLFTKKQINYLKAYFYDDLSYSEIAKKNRVSRTAIYDSINQTRKLLLSYENKLQILAKKQQRLTLYSQLANGEIKTKLLMLEEK